MKSVEIKMISSVVDRLTAYWSVLQEWLLSVPMPWRAVLVIAPLILITVLLTVYVFPCIVAAILRVFPCIFEITARLALCLEYQLTRFARAIKCRPPWLFYIIGDMLAGCVRLLQKKDSARPKKWYMLLLLAAIFVWILLVPTGKSFFNSSVNRCTAWWHEFTLYDPIYTVRHGDNLSKIARKYGIPMQDIISANKKRYPSLVKKPESIEVGWKLKIPQRELKRTGR